jgi:YD repeat-containing protein
MQLPNGVRTTTYAYHPNGKIERINFPDGRIQRFAYNAAMRLEGLGDAGNNYVRTSVDMATRTVRTSSPRHVPGAGAVPSAVASGEFSSTVVLDTLGRPFTRRGNNGQSLQYRYDANGNVETTTDAAGRVTRNTYDELNRLLTSTAADGGTTTMTYDGDGRLATVKDPRGLVTSYAYNGFGDPVKVTSPDTGATSYGYDAAGRLDTKTTADGRTIRYQWDALGRLEARSSNGVTESFAYDEGSYGKGKLSRMNDRSGETRYSYGAGGELERQTNTVFGKVYDTRWEYDSAGRLVTMTYPSGLKLQYGYNGVGQVSVISSNVRK